MNIDGGEALPDLDLKPKKRKNGRRKGKRAENEVAKLCASWWAAVEPGCEFRSTPSSGGWATPQLRGHFKVAGDLTTTAKKWPFTVEAKRRENWVLSNLYAARQSPVWAWWKQACKAALEEGRVPILFLRRNTKPGQPVEWFVMLPARKFSAWVPRLDSPALRPTKAMVGEVDTLLTTWDVLRSCPIKAIIQSSCEYVSHPALGAPLASPKPKPPSLPKAPRKARHKASQAAASSPPGLDQQLDNMMRSGVAQLEPSTMGVKRLRSRPKRSATASPKSKRSPS